ncbi:MAG: hypothetical protein OER82_13225 [Nitrosopumilus sp.]|nr:hypothetical protein [Nitrosopumilus sp.]
MTICPTSPAGFTSLESKISHVRSTTPSSPTLQGLFPVPKPRQMLNWG